MPYSLSFSITAVGFNESVLPQGPSSSKSSTHRVVLMEFAMDTLDFQEKNINM